MTFKNAKFYLILIPGIKAFHLIYIKPMFQQKIDAKSLEVTMRSL